MSVKPIDIYNHGLFPLSNGLVNLPAQLTDPLAQPVVPTPRSSS